MVEFIGFIISLLALLFIFTKQARQTPRQSREGTTLSQHEVAKEEDDPFKEFLKTMERDVTRKEAALKRPPPAPVRQENRGAPHSPPVESRQLLQKKKIKSEVRQPEPFSALEQRRLKSHLSEPQIKSQLEAKQITSLLEERRIVSKLATRHDYSGFSHYDEKGPTKPSRGRMLLHRLGRPHDIIIYQEIIDKPIALRNANR